MTPEFWAIIGVGAAITIYLSSIARSLEEVNRRLQNFWEDMLDQRRSDDDYL